MYKQLEKKADDILKLYNEGMLLNQIALATSSSTISVKKVLLRLGIDYYNVQKELYKQRLDKIISLYNAGYSQTQIQQTLNLTRKTIRTILKENNSVVYRCKSEQQQIRRGTKVNHNVFDSLSEEALYWIGVLYTDGHIETGTNAEINLALHSDDIEHLKKFKLFFESNRKINKLKNKNLFRIRINSVKLRDKLIELGFKSNKSTTIVPHILLKNSRDFWRGCVDGDGGVYVNNHIKGRSNSVFLCGTLATIIEYITFLNNNLIVAQKYPSKCKGVNLYQVQYYGKDAVNVASLLYNNASVYLERKHQKYLELIKN